MITNKDIVIVWQEPDPRKRRHDPICSAILTVGVDRIISKFDDSPQRRRDVEERLRAAIYSHLYADVRNLLPPLLSDVMRSINPTRANYADMQAKFAHIMMLLTPDVTHVEIGDNLGNIGDK